METYKLHPGIHNLCKLLDSRDERQDLWLMFELCGKPLSKTLFEVKGEFYKGERIYSVLHQQDIYNVFEESDCKVLK